jgi:hypothetical protein
MYRVRGVVACISREYSPILTSMSSLTSKLSALSALKAKVQKQEAALSSERTKSLKSLHLDYGFNTSEELIAAIKASAGPARGKPGPKPKSAQPDLGGGVDVTKKRKGKRAKITSEIKAKLKDLVKADKTGAEIAKTLGISLPSVQNIKKELGLVKARKK